MSEPEKKKIKRSRLGCHRCKKLKIKCSEEKPACVSCVKVGTKCDYSLKLTWGGRPYKNKEKRQGTQVTVVDFQESMPVTFASDGFNFVSANVHKVKTEPQEPVVKQEPTEPSLAPHLDTNYVLQKRNSDLFNNFMTTQIIPQVNGMPQMSQHEPLEPLGHENSLLVDLVDSYSTDIARIENAFPQEHRLSFYQDTMLPKHWGRRLPDFPEAALVPLPNSSFAEHMAMLDRSEELMVLNEINSIPPLLEPLPEILLKVPYYRQLFHFWINVAADNLVPAPSLYRDNPFKVVLPQMAMHYTGMLTTILAYSARVRDTLDGNHSSHADIIDQLLSRSCNELLNQLHNKSEATSDGTLATILLLSCYEVCNSNDFEKHRTHTTGASQIVSARSVSKSTLTKASSPELLHDLESVSSGSLDTPLPLVQEGGNIATFLMRWFAYVDVLGALSSTRGRDNYLRAYSSTEGYVPVESVVMLDLPAQFMEDPKRNIDYMMGFDVKLLLHFINISLLVREVEKYIEKSGGNVEHIPQFIITAALELKERFTREYEAAEEKRQLMVDETIENKLKVKKKNQKNIKALMDHDNILCATNRLFFDMGLLNLYRRVLLLPRLSPIVQDLVDNMSDVLEVGVESCSSAEVCTIFCNFCAGCETLNPAKKQFYFERFTRLAHVGNANATKSLVIMNRCWETGEDWITAANKLDIDLVLM